jgi:hypothetical protein
MRIKMFRVTLIDGDAARRFRRRSPHLPIAGKLLGRQDVPRLKMRGQMHRSQATLQCADRGGLRPKVRRRGSSASVSRPAERSRSPFPCRPAVAASRTMSSPAANAARAYGTNTMRHPATRFCCAPARLMIQQRFRPTCISSPAANPRGSSCLRECGRLRHSIRSMKSGRRRASPAGASSPQPKLRLLPTIRV